MTITTSVVNKTQILFKQFTPIIRSTNSRFNKKNLKFPDPVTKFRIHKPASICYTSVQRASKSLLKLHIIFVLGLDYYLLVLTNTVHCYLPFLLPHGILRGDEGLVGESLPGEKCCLNPILIPFSKKMGAGKDLV